MKLYIRDRRRRLLARCTACLALALTTSALRAQVAVIETDLRHTLGPLLPIPGHGPGWPMANIGKWQIDVNAAVPTWLHDVKIWRAEHLIRSGYNDAQYRRPELLWSQSNFVHTQMMAEERYFYDPEQGKYTVDKYLDDLERRYGGIDSVLIWYVYTNIGIDNRNQTDLGRDLPGGVAGFRQAIADFHRRGVKVFLPTMSWDNGTRDPGMSQAEAIAKLAAELGADGVNGDTYNGLPRTFREASDATGHPLVFQPESPPTSDEALIWNNQSWGKASTEIIPAVSKLKWLESRHMVNVENRWARDRTDDFHYIFFNGLGYVSWENVWGIWNQFTPRDAAALRRISTLEHKFAKLLVSPDWLPYAPTLRNGIFATKFPGPTTTLWTVVNRNESAFTGDQLVVLYKEGRRFYDVWNGGELHPRIKGDEAILAFPLETRGYGAVLAVDSGAAVEGLDIYLAKMHELNRVPLQSLSAEWHSLPQKIAPIAPTHPASAAPEGMVAIPGGDFDFKVMGIEIEGYTWDGMDFQYPWEPSARRSHLEHLTMKPYFMDRFPVTNAAFKKFIDAAHYHPRDDHNFLRDWKEGAPPAGWENKPVTWVSLEDARAYAGWAGKRLPHEWEWQYAAQGTDGRIYPWGPTWNPHAVPEPNQSRELRPLDAVDAHPAGASPFGVMDLVGNVWQWTDEFLDEHTRAAAVRGGNSYQPQTSYWYFPEAYRLDQHGKYLLMAPSLDRSGTLGFRCVVDAAN